MKVLIIGGGPAGMMAGIVAGQNNSEVTIIEKNEKLGKKLYITGKGRCNITNNVSMSDFFNYIVSNPKFMYASLKMFDNKACMDFFEKNGQKLKVERGERVFPISDKSSDILATFQRVLKKNDVSIKLNEKLVKINVVDNKVTSILTNKGEYKADKYILATGGASYPLTGSTGELFGILSTLGHNIVPLRPALTDIVTPFIDMQGRKVPLKEMPKIQGLSLKNVTVSVINKDSKKVIFSEFGEMIFTDKGISGPIILTLSSYITRKSLESLLINIDLKPALDENKLSDRILRDFEANSNKQFKNSLNALLPSSMIPFIIKLSKINPDKKVNLITKEERLCLVRALKNITLHIAELGPMERAIITSGGVSTKEINPKTMQSKKYENLYFAGEMIDIDALTGGFNLQLAMSTGYASGKNTI